MSSQVICFSPAICTSGFDLALPPNIKTCHVCDEQLEAMDQLVAMARYPENPPRNTPETYRNFEYVFAHSICWYVRVTKHVQATSERCPLLIWTVYDEHEKLNTWPFSVRAFTLDGPTVFSVVASSLGPLRYIMERAGLVPMMRNDEGTVDHGPDAPEIVESWL